MPKVQTGIIVLAAGASTRMGTPKQLIKVSGVSLIRRAVASALGSECGPVIVVLGANVVLIAVELENLEINVAVNSDWKTGMASSIRCGLEKLITLAPECEGVLLMVADQPNVSSDSLKKVLNARSQDDSGIVAAKYNDVLGTPAFFARKHFYSLSQLQGHAGARKLLEQSCNCVLAIELPEAAVDLDTPEDITSFNTRYLAAYENKKKSATLEGALHSEKV